MATWKRFLFKGNKVYARADDEGKPLVDGNGLAEIRYKPDDTRHYNARPAELEPLTEANLARLAREKEKRRRKSSHISVFTDGGAKPNPGPAGAGIVLEADGFRREVAVYLGKSTNNVAELVAVQEALRRIKDPSRKVRLHVDSAYVKGVLSGAWKAEANKVLIDRIRAMMRKFSALILVKVKAHAKNELNNLADRLATRARNEQKSSEELKEI